MGMTRMAWAIANGTSHAPFLIIVLSALTFALAGCGQRDEGIIGVVDSEAAARAGQLREHKIFVATTRAKDADPAVFYSGERSRSLNLASVTVTVPENHVAGKLETSGSRPPNPAKHFTVTDPNIFASGNDYVRAMEEELRRRNPKDRTALIFVHGYNTTLSEAVLRLGQFIEDTGYTGVPILFSWASGGDLLSYVYDLNSALQARDDLLETAHLLARTNVRAVDVVSHSMGNLLAVEAMRQAKLQGSFNRAGRLRYVILASPDIDVDLFRRQLSVFPAKERRFFVLISRDDGALNFSKFLARGVPRVGASSVEELAGLGVTVLDLSEIHGEGSSHTKFANSPEIVQLIGGRLSIDGPLEASNRGRSILSNIVVLPITVAGTITQ